MTSCPVFKTQNIEVFFADRGGDVLVVTFNEMGMEANGQNYWAASPLENLGISAVGFVSTKPNWFPAQDMRECAKALHDIIGDRFPERITYGMSQGGYASIKYAGLLGCRVAMCFSPQHSIDNLDIRDDRFSRYFDPMLHAGMAISAGEQFGDAYVFYDPYVEIDAAHVDRIGDFIPVNRIPVCGVGHGSSRAFASSETLRILIEACRTHDLPALRAMSARARHKAHDRPFYLALYLARRRPNISLAVWKRYRSSDSPMWFHVCFQLADAGLAADVYPWMVEIIDQHPDMPHLRPALDSVAFRLAEQQRQRQGSEILLDAR